MAQLLMPKATAVWMVDNTTLTFDQIADFTGLHPLEVQAIADDEVAIGIVGMDPITAGQLDRAEIERCEADPSARLKGKSNNLPQPLKRSKGPRYTPISRRVDKPDAIAWMLKNHPEVTDAQLCKLIGTTKPTINRIRDRTHEQMANLKPRSPVLLSLCTQVELDETVKKARIKAGLDPETGLAPGEEPPEPTEAEPVDPFDAAQEATLESVFGPKKEE